MRHVAAQLQRRQGEGPVRGVRSAGGREDVVKRAAGRNSGRPQKLGDLIQRELSELLQRELRDPRVGMITITGVDVSPDFSHAKVLYTTLDPAHIEDASQGLKRAAGFLRSHFAPDRPGGQAEEVMDGALLLDKPLGMTSNRALQDAKKLLGAKKAGHGGTLDPLASGLLVILVGEGTKFAGPMLDADKEYLATVKLGVT